MKFRKTLAVLATAVLVGIGLSVPLASSADEPLTTCTAADAYTEYVDHPEVGTPTIVVENEDYQPAVEEVSHIVTHPEETTTVHHEAVTKIVHHEAVTKEHEAVTHTEYHFAKFTRERTREKGSRGWGDWSEYGSWEKYSPETHTSWELSDAPLGSPQFHSSGTHGKNVQWERQWQALFDGQTRTVTDKGPWTEIITEAYDEVVVVTPAYDEVVVVKEAWDEKIIDVPAKPAVGEKTKTISNPSYNPAWTESIEHAAVVCPVVVNPPVETPKPVVTAQPEEETGTLAATGLDGADIAFLIVAGLLITGAGTALVVHGRKKAKQ